MTCLTHDYAFGAFNSSSKAADTFLTARLLCGQGDAELLEGLARDGEVESVLKERGLRFGEAKWARIRYALGPERGFYRATRCASDWPGAELAPFVPIQCLGSVQRDHVDELLRDGERDERSTFRPLESHLRIYLRANEMQQVFLRLEPKERVPPSAYVVQIDHWANREQREYLGGLTAVFVTQNE